MKTSILPFAIAIALTGLVACDSHNGSANDPRFQPTTPDAQLDTKPMSEGDRVAAPQKDTLAVDSLRDRSLENNTKAPKP